MATIIINDNLFKSVSKIAKRENTTENKVINQLLAKGIEEDRINEEYDCEAFEKSLDEAREEIKSGNCFSGSVEEFAKHLGVDYP